MLGIKGRNDIVVDESVLACSMRSGSVRVYATPAMIALMEKTAAESIQPYLPEGYTSVGTEVNITHVAPTPVGMTVYALSEVTDESENGKIVTFRVQAYDDAGLIGEGTHKRAIVHRARFEEKALKKSLAQARK